MQENYVCEINIKLTNPVSVIDDYCALKIGWENSRGGERKKKKKDKDKFQHLWAIQKTWLKYFF